MLLSLARDAVAGGNSLEFFIAIVKSRGLLAEAVKIIASVLKVEVDERQIDRLLAEALSGNIDTSEHRAVLLAAQAAARAYATAFEESRGMIYEPSAYCPLCGAQSRTMVKDGEDHYMICHFCYYAWRVPSQPYCPYCGTSHPLSVGLYTGRLRRLALAECQDCGSTWRLILDKSIVERAPRQLLPLIALSAERLRGTS